MVKLLLITAACLIFVSCKKEVSAAVTPVKKDTVTPASREKEFKMYEMSEMASLMERMYVENEQLKQRIIHGDTLGQFPGYMLKMRTAAMTDNSDNDAFFKEHTNRFLEAQERIYSEKENARMHFNNMVNACIKCHEDKCGGPIQRIEKLYIK